MIFRNSEVFVNTFQTYASLSTLVFFVVFIYSEYCFLLKKMLYCSLIFLFFSLALAAPLVPLLTKQVYDLQVFSSWMHFCAVRVFAESILRYGLPPSFLVNIHLMFSHVFPMNHFFHQALAFGTISGLCFISYYEKREESTFNP